MNPQYLTLFNKYINGDEKAISLLDTALDVALDTAYLRNADDQRIENLDYHDERMVIDEANDSIYTLMTELNIEPPIVGYLNLLETESEQA
jgi:hypothetical protein